MRTSTGWIRSPLERRSRGRWKRRRKGCSTIKGSASRSKPGSLHRKRLDQVAEYGDLALNDLSDTKVKFAYETQCFYSALDSLGLCQFVWGTSWQLYGPSETVELVRCGTGWDATM